MSRQYRRAQLGMLALVGLAFAGCAIPIRVDSYLERGADLSRYRTYDFAPAAVVSTGDPRLDSNPFFNERVQAAVEKQLGVRGYERTTWGTPDFRVHFHASFTQEIDVNEIDQQSGYCAHGNDCRPFVYDAGTLLIDLVDGGTNKLVWRGWAESSMDEAVDNQTWMEEKIDAAVTKIMSHLPRPS